MTNTHSPMIRSLKLILSLMLAILVTACSSSPIISGVVRDGANGNELYKVKVTTQPETLPTLTTSRGRFSIDRQMRRDGVGSEPLEGRVYTIIIEHEGYERYESQVQAGESHDVEIKLKPEKSVVKNITNKEIQESGKRVPVSTGEGARDGQ